jgi:hypothetical protein
MTSDQLAQSLRQIAAHARDHIIVNGEQRMVIELTRDRVEDIRMAADALDGGDVHEQELAR